MENVKKITFNEAIKKSDYPKENIDLIKSFINEHISEYDYMTTLYFTHSFNKNIFLIKHDLQVQYKGKGYSIFLLFYIPISFPKELRIYIEKVIELQISPHYKNFIDNETLELYYEQLTEYKPLQVPLSKLLDTLRSKFSSNFPLFKSKNPIDYFGPCILNTQQSSLVEVKPDDLKGSFNVNYFRKKVKDKILKLLNDKSFEMQKSLSELENMEKKIQQVNNENSINNIQFENTIIKLKEIESKLEYEVQEMRAYNKDYLDKYRDIIKIDDKEQFKYMVMKRTIEDYLLFIKKAYEKDLISFEDCKNKIRIFSNELFFIKYFIDKRNKYMPGFK